LRDITKIFQGVNIADPKEFKTTNKICRLWIHETCRVLNDRLLFAKDKELLYSKIKYVLGLKMRAQMDQVIQEIFGKGSEVKLEDSPADLDKIIFTDLLAEAADVVDREYVEQPDLELIKRKSSWNWKSTMPQRKTQWQYQFSTLQFYKY
jgi:hypothetical protein